MTKKSEGSPILDHSPAVLGPFRPLGHVVAESGDRSSDDNERGESRIILDSSLVDGLLGVHPEQRMVVVFVFHRAEGFDLQQHPRGDRSRAKKGVFALRSPRRPNPIGMTEVEVVAIEGNVIRVKGLDAWDGSPVLDLKPA